MSPLIKLLFYCKRGTLQLLNILGSELILRSTNTFIEIYDKYYFCKSENVGMLENVDYEKHFVKFDKIYWIKGHNNEILHNLYEIS